ncbi:thiamine-phosphate kinase [Luteipulveratus halotolerans]|uniref:Thiamine-monophosphate kinase n=1 Tax=Luteipulveratus halotolerans TaxID=1631356 RepID=A0A0L6CJ36_9MICO|nr:thiamine-phosphate kinase [Luteipulveratus halotolerans]KNX37620.1 thiamine-monophosphate kinase [Luteipulveratus halotolerans]
MTSSRTPQPGPRLSDISEERLLREILPVLPSGPAVLLGPGDDTALVRARTGAVLATTDAMVRGRDWLDEWSTAEDVGRKLVAQNAADIAAMGGHTTALLVTLVADPQTPVAWARDMARGLGAAAAEAGVAVVGGDLSSAPAGTLMVSVTALGDADTAPVLRSGARVGDQVAVSGTLGWSAAGLLLLQRDSAESGPDQVTWHRRPRPAYDQGPAAAAHGATAMLDISDGLVRDAGRIASASGVAVELQGSLLRDDVDALTPVVGDDARACVLTGGEEHSLLACFPEGELPAGWRRIGDVRTGVGVRVDGAAVAGGGWDHFERPAESEEPPPLHQE